MAGFRVDRLDRRALTEAAADQDGSGMQRVLRRRHLGRLLAGAGAGVLAAWRLGRVSAQGVGAVEVARDLGDGTAQNYLVYPDGRQVPVSCRYFVDTGACVPYRPVAAIGTVEFQTDHATGARGEVLDRALEMFADDFPALRVDRLNASSSAAPATAAFAAGTAGDLKLTAQAYNTDLIERDQLADLTDYARRDELNLDSLHFLAERAHLLDGRLYAMPYQASTFALIYNKGLLQRAGVRFPTSSFTWGELLEVSRQVTLREGDQLRQQGIATFNAIHNSGWGGLIYAAGGRFVNAEGTKTLLDQPVNVDPFTFYVELVTRHRVSGTAAEQTELRQGLSSTLAAGTGAFLIDQLVEFGRLAAIPNLDWDIAPVPLWRNGQRVTFTSDQPHVVPRSAKNPEGAWILAKYLSTSLRVQEMLATPERRGFCPVLKQVVRSSPVFHQPPPANMAAIAEGLDRSTSLPAFVGTAQWQTAVLAETLKAFTGELSPVEALRAATRAGDAAIAGARGTR